MLFEFLFVYLMIDVFCLGFSIYMYSRISVDMGTEREVTALRLLFVTYGLFLIADAVWAMGKYDGAFMSEATAGIIESATMLLMGIVAYFWFIYAENRLHAPFVASRRFAPIAAIPVILVVFLYATTGLTGWVYSLGPNGTFINGPIALAPGLVFLFYVAITAVHGFVQFLRERTTARRREDLAVIWFAIPPTVAAIFDMLFHGMPVMALSVFASLLLVFMNSQDSRINTDALTGLNNRRRAVEYIEDTLDDLSDDANFGLFMIDVDYFKTINDERGHSEGDRALQVIAEGLRRSMSGRRGLASRWGGDEFLVAMFLGADESPEDVERVFQENIDAACERNQTGYRISISAGYATARKDDDLAVVVARADQALYEQKTVHHAEIARGIRG